MQQTKHFCDICKKEIIYPNKTLGKIEMDIPIDLSNTKPIRIYDICTTCGIDVDTYLKEKINSNAKAVKKRTSNRNSKA